jgi:hypothetical protein
MKSCLNNGIGLSMNRTDTMSINHKVPDLVTVILPSRGAVEACGKDTFFSYKDAPNKGSVTGAAF